MAEGRRGDDVVSEFLQQNPHLAQWVESLAGESETEKQWRARREFILRNMEGFPTIHPGSPSPSLDRLISLSMVWANHIFLGCRYPQPVMEKITEMAEGIAVQNAPTHKTRDEIMGMSKDASKKPKPGVGYRAKTGPTLQAPKEHQPFFNRLYKAIAWKLVSAGGFGPNIDHFEILRTCVESAKASLGCVFVPLKDIPDLPAGRAQQGGLVCELRCQTVYLGTGYGRGEDSARAMAAKEALKLFQSRKVTVKIFRRKYSGRDVEDLVLHDDQMRNSSFPPALSYPFDPE